MVGLTQVPGLNRKHAASQGSCSWEVDFGGQRKAALTCELEEPLMETESGLPAWVLDHPSAGSSPVPGSWLPSYRMWVKHP